MKYTLFIIIFLLIPTMLFAAQGSLSGTARDWLKNPMTGVSVHIYVFALTGTGVSTQLANQAWIAEATSSSSDGTWINNTDADIVQGTTYFIVYFYGGSYQAADGKTKSNLFATKFMTAQ